MVSKRKNDPEATSFHFRSERFFREGENWFFYTREGSIEGPCEDMIEAQSRLEKYIGVVNLKLLPEDCLFSLEPHVDDIGQSPTDPDDAVRRTACG